MKSKTLLLLFLALTMVMQPIKAKHLTAEEALLRAKAQSTMQRLPGKLQNLQLTKVLYAPDTEVSAYYVFSAGSGFVILTADDEMIPVMGYSDNNRFDPNNIPPAMIKWLNDYALLIKQPIRKTLPISRADSVAGADSLDNNEPALIPDSLNRVPIAPLLKTAWDQDRPYNDQCPVINGQHAYTGCVATALAQIMNFYQWPESGIGFRKYSFKYNNVEYQDSLDFANTFFDWSQMIEDYSTMPSTAEQRDAVASLMHACGVASLMSYGLEGSGATDLNAARGMVKFLNYDRGMTWLNQEWFTREQWSSKVYSELAQGRPVLYGGQSASGMGHEFVCDGYSADDYFHINWGWSGIANGYYYLYNLTPEDQGIGGGGDGYNFGQTILTNIKPADPDSVSNYTPVLYCENFYTQNTQYPRNDRSTIDFICSVFNGAIEAMDYTIGLQFKADDGSIEYINVGDTHLAIAGEEDSGIGGFKFTSNLIPVGNWEVSPVYKTGDGPWQAPYFNRHKTNTSLKLEVTKSLIKVIDDRVTLDAALLNWTPANEADSVIVAGNTYDFSYSIHSSGAWSGELMCLIIGSNDKICGYSEPMTVTFDGASTVENTWTINLSKMLNGKYLLALAQIAGDQYHLLTNDYIDIVGLDLPGSISFRWIDADDKDAIFYVNRTYDFDFEVTTTGWWTGTRSCMLLLNKDGNWYSVSSSDESELSYPDAGVYQHTWTLNIPDIGIQGDYYVTIVDGNSFNLKEAWPITVSFEQPPVVLTAVYMGWMPKDIADKAIYPGHTYEFEYEFKTDAPWSGKIYCVLSNGVVESRSQTMAADFESSQTHAVTFDITVDEASEVGNYELSFIADQDGELSVIDTQTINVVEYDGILSIINDDPEIKYFNLQGIQIDKPRSGIYIMRKGSQATKVIK